MNAKFGGFHTSPKIRLLPCLVVAVIQRWLRVLLIEVGEVVHEVVEAISKCTNILIHSMKSVVDLPHALVELQKFIIGDIVIPLLLWWWFVGPSVPHISFWLLLLLLLSFPSSVVLLLFLLVLLLLLFFFVFVFRLCVRLELSNNVPHLIFTIKWELVVGRRSTLDIGDITTVQSTLLNTGRITDI